MSNRRRRSHSQPKTDEKLNQHENHTLQARTQNQSEYIRSIIENDIVFCVGPPGSGKTFIPSGIACSYLINKKINKIIITRPTVEVGHSIGFLPGSAFEKVQTFMTPILNAIENFLGKTELDHCLKFKTIEVIPIQYMRGLTFDNSFIILDEAQDCLPIELKTVLTRFGCNSKMVVIGDLSQSDLQTSAQGAFLNCIEKLKGITGIGIVQLDISDIQRSPLVKKIVEKLS